MKRGYLHILKMTTGYLAITMCLQTAVQAGGYTIHSYQGKEVTAPDIISNFIGDCATNEDSVKCGQVKSGPPTRGIRIHGQQRKRLEATGLSQKLAKPAAKRTTKAYQRVAAKKTNRIRTQPGTCPQSGSQVALPITFALNSAILESAAYTKLRQMAMAMKSDTLGSCKFAVEGHTDASGGADLNLQLSKKRAYAVREFLVSMEIDSSRLLPTGKGEAEPLPRRDPHAAENRRVQFRIVQN